jgi:hypothetical protein
MCAYLELRQRPRDRLGQPGRVNEHVGLGPRAFEGKSKRVHRDVEGSGWLLFRAHALVAVAVSGTRTGDRCHCVT